ncbi:hypothetical protein CWB99_01045, partial [Pseudoalteromonas rubra]
GSIKPLHRFTFASFLVDNSSIKQRLDQLVIPVVEDQSKSLEHLKILFGCIGTVYQLSLRRLEQLFSKFESIVTYVDKGTYFDCYLMVQLMCEYDQPAYNYSYDLKKKGSDRVSKELKEKFNRNPSCDKDGSAEFASLVYGKNDNRLGWVKCFKHIQNLLSSTKGQIAVKVENRRRYLFDNFSVENDTENFVINAYTIAYKSRLITDKTLPYDDYFKYVELAAQFE